MSGPVFVVGCPRSGITVLHWAIASHAAYCAAGQTHFFFRLHAEGHIQRAFDHSAPPGSWLAAHSVAYAEFLGALGSGVDQMMRRHSGDCDWVDGSPENLLVADAILAMLPDAHMFIVVRDPRWVCASMLASGFNEGWAHDLGAAIREWRHYAAAAVAVAQTYPERACVIRQEDMLRRPEQVAARIGERLGLVDPETIAEFLRTERLNSSYDRDRSATIGSRRDQTEGPEAFLSSHGAEVFQATAPLAEQFGYERDVSPFDEGHRWPLKPGSVEYAEHVREEIRAYSDVFSTENAQETLFQPVPPVYVEIERRATARIVAATGNDLAGHIKRHLTKPGAKLLSLGSGPCGVEINFAQASPDAEFVCADINPELLALGSARAKEHGLAMTFIEADLNTMTLPKNEFDVVFCHAALHHLIELEWIAEQIKGALRDDGKLIVVDIITRNGYAMWPETRKVVENIWGMLPRRLRMNHTAYADGPRFDARIWEADTSASGMECARSEAILQILNDQFVQQVFVPYFSISRRFFDTMYGPNYDLSRKDDEEILDRIWNLDTAYLDREELHPESFFGIYGVR